MKTTTDVTPRFRKLKNQKVKIFWHPCHVCGDVWGASFGENFEPKKNKFGTWYCGKCYDRKQNREKKI